MIARRCARAIVAALLALAAVACGGSSATATLPAVELAGLGGATGLDPSTLREPALVNLWATWCAPCKRELPDLQRVADDPALAVRVIGVNVGDDEASVTSFVADLGVTFEQYVDLDGIVQTALRVSSLPATVAIGPDGRVVEVHQGPLDLAGLRALAERAARA